MVKEDAGSSVNDWVSKAELKRFKRTANSVGAVGDEARHGKENTEPPPNPMALREAESLILKLVRDWLEAGDRDEQ